MAVPKITGIRCRDGSVQAKLMIQLLHKYIFFYYNAKYSLQYSNSKNMSCRTLRVVKDVGMGLLV